LKGLMPIFKKSLRYTICFYLIVCTVFILGVVIQGWITPGRVFGTVLIFLTFFLAVPLGILEEVENMLRFHIAQPSNYANMDTVTSYLLIYISNLVLAVVLALLFSILCWTVINVKAGIQISNKGE